MAADHSQVIVDGGEGSGSTIGAQTANLSDAVHSHTGWVIGGGTEAMVGQDLSVQLNLMDVMFDHRNLSDHPV